MEPRLTITERQAFFLKLRLGWLLLTTILVTLGLWWNPIHRAVLQMGRGLILLWIVVGGGLMSILPK